MKWVKSILLLALILGVLGISGCVSDNNNSSNTKTVSNGTNTFTNSYMSFIYPGTRTIVESSSGKTVKASKSESNVVHIDFFDTKGDWQEDMDSMVEFSGATIKTLNKNNVTYKYLKTTSNGQPIIFYYFQKNGKYFMVGGLDGDEDVMNIAQSVQ